MKKTISFLFILYFLILIGAGTIFYFKYIRNFSLIETKPILVETVNPRSLIYYTQANILYRADPQLQNNPLSLEKIETLTLQGEIGQLDLNIFKSQIIYDIKNPDGNWEVWQGDFNNIQKEKIGFKGVAELEDYEDFSNPKYSPDKTKMAILGQKNTADTIFIKDLSGAWQKVADKIGIKITDYSWSKDSQKLIYCSSNPPVNETKNGCWTINLETKTNTKSFEREVKKISWNKTDNIFYLSKSDPPHIYTIYPEIQEHAQIDDVSAPKTIANFQIDYQGKKIAYEIIADQKSDIYLSNIDGSNRLQLTTDGNTRQPIFSPDDEIAFLRQKDGIYLVKTDKTNERKLINLEDSIDLLILWR